MLAFIAPDIPVSHALLGKSAVWQTEIISHRNFKLCKFPQQHRHKIRVRPYYLYQCDPVVGSGHFRTTIEKGLEIIRGLRGHTSGYAVPTYVVDAPGGGGKIPLLPEYFVGREDGYALLKNYEDKIFRYPDFTQ